MKNKNVSVYPKNRKVVVNKRSPLHRSSNVPIGLTNHLCQVQFRNLESLFFSSYSSL